MAGTSNTEATLSGYSKSRVSSPRLLMLNFQNNCAAWPHSTRIFISIVLPARGDRGGNGDDGGVRAAGMGAGRCGAVRAGLRPRAPGQAAARLRLLRAGAAVARHHLRLHAPLLRQERVLPVRAPASPPTPHAPNRRGSNFRFRYRPKMFPPLDL
jgi:hypothetical protein